jgi:oligopeptide/dipeptide ABC transporter ATP-binding protein
MVFQDPMTALNPVMTVGSQLDEVFIRHKKLNKREARKSSITALRLVGVPDPERRYRDYPHELSGGLRQRVLIAIAFALNPKLIIADEPTTALDVTIQAQVLDLLKSMQKAHGTSLLLITHDLSVVAYMADIVYVMYAGKIVEKAPLKELFQSPLHPYTEGLLASVSRVNAANGRFVQIPGEVPDPANKPSGCHFHPRCRYCVERCLTQMPPLTVPRDNREIRCWNPLVREGA